MERYHVPYRCKPHLDNIAGFILFTQSQDIDEHYKETQEEWDWDSNARSLDIVPDASKEDYIKRYTKKWENLYSIYDELLESANEKYQAELEKDNILRSKGILYHLAMIAEKSLDSFSSEIDHDFLHADSPALFEKNINNRFKELHSKFKLWYSLNKDQAKKFEPNPFEIFDKILKRTDRILKDKFNTKKQQPELPDCFKDKKQFNELLKLLKKKEYIEVIDGNYFWIKPVNHFAAMAQVCKPLLKKEHQDNQLGQHRIWTGFFKHPKKTKIVSNTYFKTSKEAELDPHRSQFDFIKKHFKLP